jgi:hypothetical protein
MSSRAIPPLSQPCAGIHARADALFAAVATSGRPIAEQVFVLSSDGLGRLADWLSAQGVGKAALLQGEAPWPWQRAQPRRKAITGPVGLDTWLQHEGPDAFARLTEAAAWQPVVLALRDRFALFLVRPQMSGGPYAVMVNRDTARSLAAMLAGGDFMREYPKQALERLIEQLSRGEPGIVEECLSFFTSETRGHWHNRARAKIARRLKHCALGDADRQRVVEAIGRRLMQGNFSEQFRDQLRLVFHLDPAAAAQIGQAARESALPHVRSHGEWLAAHHPPAATPGIG